MIDTTLLQVARTAGRPRTGRPRPVRRRASPPFHFRAVPVDTDSEAAGLDDRPVRPEQSPAPGEGPPAGPADAAVCSEPRGRVDHDAGMSTVEYAVGTVVAAAFAAVLYKIVTGDSVVTGLTSLIDTALSSTF